MSNFIYLVSEDWYRDSIDLNNFADTFDRAKELVIHNFTRYIDRNIIDISIKREWEKYVLLNVRYTNNDEYEPIERNKEYTLFKVYNTKYWIKTL